MYVYMYIYIHIHISCNSTIPGDCQAGSVQDPGLPLNTLRPSPGRLRITELHGHLGSCQLETQCHIKSQDENTPPNLCCYSGP